MFASVKRVDAILFDGSNSGSNRAIGAGDREREIKEKMTLVSRTVQLTKIGCVCQCVDLTFDVYCTCWYQ